MKDSREEFEKQVKPNKKSPLFYIKIWLILIFQNAKSYRNVYVVVGQIDATVSEW